MSAEYRPISLGWIVLLLIGLLVLMYGQFNEGKDYGIAQCRAGKIDCTEAAR